MDVEEDVWERAVDVGCGCCSGVNGVRFVVGVDDGEVGTKICYRFDVE